MAVKDNSLVVPSGDAWNELKRIYPLLIGCRVVPAGTDATGFFFNEQKTELVLKLPLPDPDTGVDPTRLTTVALEACGPNGTQTYRFVIVP